MPVSSKRSQALLAMLATSSHGERTRSWLQGMLWCGRDSDQARASLRRELSNLRKIVNVDGAEILCSDNQRVWLALDKVTFDVSPSTEGSTGQDFLEGLDIAGEDAFEDWLRDQRRMQASLHKDAPAQEPANAPTNTSPQPVAIPAQPGLTGDETISLSFVPFVPTSANGTMETASLQQEADRLVKSTPWPRWLSVISPSVSFDPADNGNAVASYSVEVSRPTNECTGEVSLSLTHNVTGRSIWNERFPPPSAPLDDDPLFAVSVAVAAIASRIDRNEQRIASRISEQALTPMGCVFRARWHLGLLKEQDLKIARSLLERALDAEPHMTEATIEMAWYETRRLWLSRGDERDIRAARRAAQNAILCDGEDARGYMLAGITEFWLRQPLRAERLLERAVQLDPSLAMAHAQLGSARHHKGDHKAAIRSLERARLLSPTDIDLFYIEGDLAIAYLFDGQLDAAILHAEDALARRSGYWHAHVTRIVALVEAGRMEEARAANREFRELHPGFEASHINWLPYIDTSKNGFLTERLNQLRS